MRLVDWRVMDKTEVINLIIEHNASVEAIAPEVKRRMRARLTGMSIKELWAHINNLYNGRLYAPDIPVKTDERELRRREIETDRARKLSNTRPVVIRHYNPPLYDTFTETDDCYNFLWGLSCVHRVDQLGTKQIAVLLNDKSMAGMVRRRVVKRYPGVVLSIVGEGL
jgi:hypothetical protein